MCIRNICSFWLLKPHIFYENLMNRCEILGILADIIMVADKINYYICVVSGDFIRYFRKY